MSYINEMENQGIILKGRTVENDFESLEALRSAVALVDKWAAKTGLPLAFVYCGSTINWPDDFEFTPSVIGLVLTDAYELEDGEGESIKVKFSRDLLRPEKSIPDDFWTDLTASGVEVSGQDETLLAVAGWAWVELEEDGESVAGISAEDDGFMALDLDPILSGSGQLTLSVGYC